MITSGLSSPEQTSSLLLNATIFIFLLLSRRLFKAFSIYFIWTDVVVVYVAWLQWLSSKSLWLLSKATRQCTCTSLATYKRKAIAPKSLSYMLARRPLRSNQSIRLSKWQRRKLWFLCECLRIYKYVQNEEGNKLWTDHWPFNGYLKSLLFYSYTWEARWVPGTLCEN